jgi:hypothetical protein
MLPPPFREGVVNPTMAIGLACSSVHSHASAQMVKHQATRTKDQLTVARQRRTFTGFVIKPAHPGDKVPWWLKVYNCLKNDFQNALQTDLIVRQNIGRVNSACHRLFVIFLTCPPKTPIAFGPGETF